LPSNLIERFKKSVAGYGNPEVRALVADYFRTWVASLTPANLVILGDVEKLITLTQVSPETYLPQLVDLVCRSTKDQLMQVSGEGDGLGHWGPRRRLVWLFEELCRFPEFLGPCEEALLRLALAETEERISNNATGVWTELYRISLSGTGTPFDIRFAKLKKRVLAEDEDISRLGFEALEDVFDMHVSRTVGASIIAGRIPPEQWQPKTNNDVINCLKSALDFLLELATDSDVRRANAAIQITAKHLRSLLGWGFLDTVKAILGNGILSVKLHSKVTIGIDHFLHYDATPEKMNGEKAAEYVAAVKEWTLERQPKPTDLKGRMRALVGIEPWEHARSQDEHSWGNELRALAADLMKQEDVLRAELSWLLSTEAKSAGALGEALGRLDDEGRLLDLVLKSSVSGESIGLVRGYVMGQLDLYPLSKEIINAFIDSLQDAHPAIAYELFMTAPDFLNGFNRTISLIDAKKLNSKYLHGFAILSRQKKLSFAQMKAALERLLAAGRSGEARALATAIDLIWQRIQGEEKSDFKELRDIADDEDLFTLVLQVLEAGIEDSSLESYRWAHIVRDLLIVRPPEAIRLSIRALSDGKGIRVDDDAASILVSAAAQHSELIMNLIGEALLDEEKEPFLSINRLHVLFLVIPLEIVKAWLSQKGVKGARVLAKHLPVPSDSVPALTEYVLATFEGDDEVFKNFIHGTYGMRTYIGDIAAEHEKEGSIAAKFIMHPLRRVREWANFEIQESKRQANWWRQQDEEFRVQ
jgi:hypothetical protein